VAISRNSDRKKRRLSETRMTTPQTVFQYVPKEYLLFRGIAEPWRIAPVIVHNPYADWQKRVN